MSGPKTILILSRGRLARMFRAAALDLARDHRVVVLVTEPIEAAIWADAAGITLIDMAADMAREVAAHAGRLVERARAIELATNLPLYKAASNYLLYRRFAKDYFDAWPPWYDTEQQMLEEYVGSYGVLSRVIEQYRPALILHEALDLIATLVALALAYRNGIFNLGMVFAPGVGDGTIFLYYGLHRQNLICSSLLRRPELITAESRDAARSLISATEQRRLAGFSHVEERRAQLSGSRWQSAWHAARRLARSGTWRKPRLLARRWRDWRWLSRHMRHDIPDGPFILFLMHLQPEASTASQAPRWVDQERLIEQMAINAPQGIRIVVKENPRCYGWRGERYFGALADLANVHLCHPAVDTQTLVSRASAVVTITGSVGFEAILLGTRVAVLGRPAYSEFSGVRRLDRPEEIFAALADPSWRADAFEDDRERFVAAYLQSLHALGKVESGRIWPSPEIAGPNFAGGVRRTLSFIAEHELTPRQFDPGMRLVEPQTVVSTEPVA